VQLPRTQRTPAHSERRSASRTAFCAAAGARARRCTLRAAATRRRGATQRRALSGMADILGGCTLAPRLNPRACV
jgi:hypothetical protein